MRIIPLDEFTVSRQVDYGTPEQNEAVNNILLAVKQDGDAALRRYSEEFDGVQLDSLLVSAEEIDEAYSRVGEPFLLALRQAASNIRSFHEKQKRLSWMDTQPDGSMIGQLLRPLRRVGIYVPGGKAAYPSSVLMNAIPAQAAGVSEIVMVTPPTTAGQAGGINPYILVAAREAGIKEIYRVGGAQAIAALAYGTETIMPVDKIVGPGNIYVALAKRSVFGMVDIDMIAGPTDIVVLADESANASYIAADLLAQAEHDEMSPVTLITTSKDLANDVLSEVYRQLQSLPRKAVAERAIQDHGRMVVISTLEEGISLVNQIAPEHVELLVDEPLRWMGSIRNAGAIFFGEYSPEPVGDYFAGPNHVLPTNGTARFSSPLNVDDFMKKSSVIYYSKEALLQNGEMIMTLARSEGLEGHARSVELRLMKEGEQR